MLSNSNNSHSLSAYVSSLLIAVTVCAFAAIGCSKPAAKEKQEKKKVVQEMNIQTPEEDGDPKTGEAGDNDSTKVDAKKTTPATPASHEDEVEVLSLDLSDETVEEVEEELPILGSGG